MHLPDINFWLAIAFQSHVHHLSAKAWMQSAARQSCCFCRVTQMGFLRLSTNRRVFPLDALPMNEAWRIYDELLSDERVVFAEEPDDLEMAWRTVTQHQMTSTNVWSDAYLAAFARMADLGIVTFDKGFAQYKDLHQTILS
jgi:toxin-antitoxin system PIN domain toxin